jgi:hypothetical protein
VAQILPGTVLVVRSAGFAGWWIRFGAALRGHPNLQNHVAVVHHADPAGTLWCIEGRPGGVGWRDATAYLASRWTISNSGQPLTPVQRGGICKVMEALLGTPYDWQAIVADGAASLGWKLPGWDAKWTDGQVAGHVVCSSAAAYAYHAAKAAHPGGDRGCLPAGWTQWIITRGWEPPSVTPG